MKARCLNPKAPNYKYYGARGIQICDRWLDFNVFVAEVGQPPSASHTIDRIDNDGHYEPGNVRWATPREQAGNKRPQARRVRHGGGTTLAEGDALVAAEENTWD